MRRLRTAMTATVVLALAECASGAAPQGPVDWDERLDLGVPGGLIETVMDVEYYPACGNEPLRWDDETYYPYEPADQSGFPNPTETGDLEPQAAPLLGGDAVPAEVSTLGWARASAVVPTVGGARAVVAPGPGDDLGTLYLYEGGHAHWRANSGDLATWLTTTEIEYMWVC